MTLLINKKRKGKTKSSNPNKVPVPTLTYRVVPTHLVYSPDPCLGHLEYRYRHSRTGTVLFFTDLCTVPPHTLKRTFVSCRT